MGFEGVSVGKELCGESREHEVNHRGVWARSEFLRYRLVCFVVLTIVLTILGKGDVISKDFREVFLCNVFSLRLLGSCWCLFEFGDTLR